MKQLFTKHKTTIILVAVLALIYFLQTRLVYAAEDVILYETDELKNDGKMLETGQKFQAKKGDFLGFIFSTKPTANSQAWRVKRKGSYFILNPQNPAYKRGLF